MLPGFPDNLSARCFKPLRSNDSSSESTGGWSDYGPIEIEPDFLTEQEKQRATVLTRSWRLRQSQECSQLRNHLVSPSELKNIFGDRHVFGVIDACHAGALDLGENSSMLLATQPSQVAVQASRWDQNGHGFFTESIKNLLDQRCDLDIDDDQRVSFHELASHVRSARLNRRVFMQHPIIHQRSWLGCFLVDQPTTETLCHREYARGEHVYTTKATNGCKKSSCDPSEVCQIPAGTNMVIQEPFKGYQGRVRVSVSDLENCTTAYVSAHDIRVSRPSLERSRPTEPSTRSQRMSAE